MEGTATRTAPGRIWHGRVAFAVAAAVFVVARGLPFTAHARVGLVLDSYDYIRLAHTKSPLAALAASRPPVILLVMKVLSGRWELVTWAQFTITVIAWILLAAVAQPRGPHAVQGAFATVAIIFLIGSGLDVVQWDRLIGTESLSLSLGVLLVRGRVLAARARGAEPRCRDRDRGGPALGHAARRERRRARRRRRGAHDLDARPPFACSRVCSWSRARACSSSACHSCRVRSAPAGRSRSRTSSRSACCAARSAGRTSSPTGCPSRRLRCARSRVGA